MDTVQRVLDDLKMRNRFIYYIESINHIDDDIRDNCTPWTILMSACNNGDADIVERCISLGADVNKLDFLGQHPLYLALHYFHIHGCSFSTSEILFKAGVSPNIKCGPNIKCEDIPILFYLHTGTEMTHFLLKHGALTNQFYKYKEFIKPESHMYFIKVLAKRRWVVVKCIVLALGIHKRAVVTANHPLRLLERGEFNNSD